MTVYAGLLKSADVLGNPTTVIVATLAAFAGTFLGARLVKKVTIHFLQVIVSVMLLLVAFGLGSGVL
jgi:uncharacterized membrane protein YfcA